MSDLFFGVPHRPERDKSGNHIFHELCAEDSRIWQGTTDYCDYCGCIQWIERAMARISVPHFERRSHASLRLLNPYNRSDKNGFQCQLQESGTCDILRMVTSPLQSWLNSGKLGSKLFVVVHLIARIYQKIIPKIH